MSGIDNCKGLGVPGHRVGKKVTQVKIVPSCQDPTFYLQRQVLEKRSTQGHRSSSTRKWHRNWCPRQSCEQVQG